MSGEGELPKLRMAPIESAEALVARVERERRAVSRQREHQLEDDATRFRVGSVPYLNAAPLTRGLESTVVYVAPSQLAEKLRAGELDAALVSVVEVLLRDGYDVLDGVAIASLGEVRSVYLAHTGPLERVRMVHCDPASMTSVWLLKILLGERGIHAEFKTLAGYDHAALPENVLLIGNPAIDYLRDSPRHEIWDLGAAWLEMTGLPFVYAVWAMRREKSGPELRRLLREAKDFGLETLDHLIRTREEYDEEFRRDYLGWHIHYHLGTDEKRGLARFVELMRKHGADPLFAPRYVW